MTDAVELQWCDHICSFAYRAVVDCNWSSDWFVADSWSWRARFLVDRWTSSLPRTRQRMVGLLSSRLPRLTATVYTHNDNHLWPFLRHNQGEPVPEETFTHSHLSWSSTILYLLPPSATIHSIVRVQFTYLTVFLHNLSPSSL